MKNLAHFVQIIDRQTIAVTIVALICTYACLKFGIIVDLPFELVAVAIVFPIVFTISSAFQRREGALAELAEFRANLMAMFLAHRDWHRSDDRSPHVRAQLRKLHEAVRDSVQHRDPATTRIVYGLFSNLSLEQETMRTKGGVSASEIARLNQYLRNTIANFEKLRNVADYRTPIALRAYTQVFLNVFPVLFAPYFALVSSQGWWPLGFVMAILYSLVLVGLDNIQEGLENPFDGLGIDDINFDGTEDDTWFESAASLTSGAGEERTVAAATQSH